MKKRLSVPSVLCTITLLASLQGCSSQLFSQSESVIPLKILKQVTPNISTKVRWKAQTRSVSPNSNIHPYLSKDAVIVAGGHSVSAWDKSTGRALWSQSIEETISGGVNGGNGLLFIGTDHGNAIALNEKTGKIKWIKHLKAEILSLSIAKQGLSVFRTIDGKLHALSTQTGGIVWQQQQRTPVLSLYGASTPILVGSYVVAGFDNGKIAAYELQKGTPVWEATLALPRGENELDKMIDVDGKLKTLGNGLFATSFHGRITGIDLKTGNIHWAKKHSSYAGTDANAEGVYTTDATGNVWRLEPQTGNPMWKMDDLERRVPTTPTLIHSNLLVVGDKEGNLHFIHTNNGRFAARIKGDSAGYSIAPIVEGNTLYSLGRSGMLMAITVQ